MSNFDVVQNCTNFDLAIRMWKAAEAANVGQIHQIINQEYQNDRERTSCSSVKIQDARWVEVGKFMSTSSPLFSEAKLHDVQYFSRMRAF